MFAMHNSFRTALAHQMAMNGSAIFKPVALVVSDLSCSQGLFVEYDQSEKANETRPVAHCHWCHISMVKTDQSGITLIGYQSQSTAGVSGDGVPFVDSQIVERHFGPYADDDLVLIAAHTVPRPRLSRFSGSL